MKEGKSIRDDVDSIKSKVSYIRKSHLPKDKKLFKGIRRIPFFLGLASVISFLYEKGFDIPEYYPEVIIYLYLITIISGIISISGRFFFRSLRPRLKIIPFDTLLLAFLILILLLNLNIITLAFHISFFQWIYFAVFLVFIREFSALKIDFKKTVVNPALLFVSSFLAIIIAGTIILMFPNATTQPIKLIDSLFTSTSAVCVTGLCVVDTGTYFTRFGQIIILLLIQVGGIGIMTFASYFSYFFRGVSSYENQLILSEMNNTDRISEVFSFLKQVILITFLIEAIGCFFVYESLDSQLIPHINERIFFAIFHAVSAFCNAGFSTLQNGFAENAYQYNYFLHLVIAFLIITGGIGFPIIFNLLTFLKEKIKSFFRYVFLRKRMIHAPWLINLNTRIVLVTTLVLLVFGTLMFFIFEYNNTLAHHSFFGKIVTSFFGSVTPRTAGFNTVNTGLLLKPTVLIMIFLMWVGASPGSTGGGIKTSAFAVAIMNIINLSRGMGRTEVFKREISTVSVNRAFAVILLSFAVIFISVLCMTLYEPDKSVLDITFECVSAFGTVGLSRGITADLNTASKTVLVMTMFLGRVGLLTLLMAFFRKISSDKYRFPSENILIN